MDAVITVTNPIPSSITTAARIWPTAVVGNVIAVPDRRHRLHGPPQSRAEGRKPVVVDHGHQQPGEDRDRRRHGRDHDRRLSRIGGAFDQPVEPALESSLV